MYPPSLVWTGRSVLFPLFRKILKIYPFTCLNWEHKKSGYFGKKFIPSLICTMGIKMHTQNADLREKYFYPSTCLNWEKAGGHPVFKKIKNTYCRSDFRFVFALQGTFRSRVIGLYLLPVFFWLHISRRKKAPILQALLCLKIGAFHYDI